MPAGGRTEVLIAGAGIGGVAAALAVARAGRSAILTEETDWIGGQLTSQAVPPDEHGWIEQFGCTAGYRHFREGVRSYYRDHYPLTERSRADTCFNPGNGWVSPLCHEPRVALAVLKGMLAPYIDAGRLRILYHHRPLAAEYDGDRLRAVTFQNGETGQATTIEADCFLDATELGDLLPLCGAEFVTGTEAREQTGEPSAPPQARRTNAQAFSVCFAVDHTEGMDYRIPRPREYDYWRAYIPKLSPPWPGALFSWTTCHPRTMEPVANRFNPHHESNRAFSGLWSYRRILARDALTPGSIPSDICLINWPMIDYLQGDLCTCALDERAHHIERAKKQSMSFLYWLQTEAPRPDGGTGYPGLRLRRDITGTRDGLAKFPYIRESRRILSERTICEQHISAAVRRGKKHAEQCDDSVGVGFYRIDLHPTCGGDNYLDVPALPFQIPLGALIPIRFENLLAASKNIGTTHITNGCYRVHPVEWNIGEAAGALAAFCMHRQTSPRAVHENRNLLRSLQDELYRNGVELEWPEDLRLDEGDPHRHAM